MIQSNNLIMLLFVFAVVGTTVVIIAVNSNAFSCQGASWSTENSTITTEEFQDYLFVTQNTCNRRVQVQPIGSAGIGATMKEAVNLFLLFSESGYIYRPHDSKPYLFADMNKLNCVANIRSIDCYFEPLSYCATLLTPPTLTQKQLQQYNLLPPKIDTCTMGRLLKRPLSWLQAQVLEYIIRPSPKLAKDMFWREDSIFSNINPKYRSSISVQMRTGSGETLDGGRSYVPSLQRYMELIDFYADELAASGRPVGTVYLSSNAPHSTYKSTEFMTTSFPRNFTYAAFPHTNFGKYDVFNVLRDSSRKNASFRDNLEASSTIYDLTVEYFSDINIYAQTDIYIGGTSSVSDLVFLLRSVRLKDYNPNNTCIVDLTTKENPLICGVATPQARSYWLSRLHFDGGVML